MTKLERGGYNTNEPNGNAVYQRYNFTYNDFGDTTKITLGSNHEYTLAKYTFAERGGLLKKLEYGNGHAVSYTYDNYGRTVQTVASSGDRYTYTYTGDGQLYEVKDEVGERRYRYHYDTLHRLIGSTMKTGDTVALQTNHRYDQNNRMVRQSWVLPGKTYQEGYTYNDSNGRLTQKSVRLPGGVASNSDLKSPKSKAFAADYRALMKSSETVENKGFFAVCSPNLFIKCYTVSITPAPLIRAKARARKSHNRK